MVSSFECLYYLLPFLDHHCVYLYFHIRYRPSLPVSYVSSTLGFADDDECVDFLLGVEAILLDGHSAIDCKQTHSKLASIPTN